MVEQSMRDVGAARPIVIDEDGVVLAGNATIEAAAAAGIERVQVVDTDGETLVAVRRTGLTPEQKTKLALYDNRTAELAEWDTTVLQQIATEMPEATKAMWSDKELRALIAAASDEGHGDADAEPQIDRAAELQQQWRTATGQLWQLGEHRLLCGDSTKAEDVARLMGGEKINIAFTSPPYAEQRDYDAKSGFKPIAPDQYVEWFAPVAAHVAAHLAPDGSWFVNIKPSCDGLDTFLYVMDLVIAHVRTWGWHFATEFCWERNGVPKSVTQRFKNQFEPIYQFVRGRWKMRPDHVRHASENVPRAGGAGSGETSWRDVQGGRGAKSVSGSFGAAKKRRNGTSALMSDVQGRSKDAGEYIGPGMAYPGNRIPAMAATHDAVGHAAAFPVGLPSFFINAFTDAGDVVYDPFTGSGSTIIAAENTHRQARAMEISPDYCAMILQRYQDATQKTPVLLEPPPP
jgi:DNA modification methylase